MLRELASLLLVLSLAGVALAQVLPAEPASQTSSKRAVVIPIEGEINGITARAVKTRFERAKGYQSA